MSDHCNKNDHQTCSHTVATGYEQTLAEMDFENSIFNACVQGDLERVKSLIAKQGPAVANEQDKQSGYSGLHDAARNNHLGICRLLLELGADPDLLTNSCQSTALHRAAYMGHVDVVGLLLAYKANVLLVDCEGKTALHKCVEGKRAHWIPVAELLVKTDPRLLEVADRQNRSPEDMCPELKNLKNIQNTLYFK